MATPNDNASKAAKEALKNVEAMIKKQEALNKSTKNLADSWNSIASQVFKMDGAQFFESVEKSPEQMAALASEVEKLKGTYKLLGNEFSDMLSKTGGKFSNLQEDLIGVGNKYKDLSKTIASNNSASFKLQAGLSAEIKKRLEVEGGIDEVLKKRMGLTASEIKDLEKIQKYRNEEKLFQDETKKYSIEMEKKLSDLIAGKKEIGLLDEKVIADVMKQISQGKSLNDILENATPEAREFLALLGEDTEALKDISKGMTKAADGVIDIRKQAKEMNKEFSLTKSLSEGMKSMASGFGSIIKKDWIGSLMKFDEVLNETQKQTGINMDDNATAFASLQTNVAQFGMSVEGAGKMMATMSKELNTTNFGVLSEATKNFAAIEGATGAASEDITTIAGQMMRMGSSSEQVHDMFQDTSNIAKKFGISSKGVIADISKNLGKWKNAGFQGGEKSLAKMAATAARLNMSIDAAFDMSEKARSIEGAMDMASELQLAGGSFSNINPMDLLSAARKGPAEMQKILGQMGKDIGKFNEKGEFEIDPVDADRLRIVAEATGVKLEDLRNGIEKTTMDGQKLAGISEDVFANAAKGVEGWDADMAKSSLADMMERTKDGKIVMKTDSVDLFKQAGITDLQNITDTQMQDLLKIKDKDKKNMEDENKRNQSLKQSFDNFINAFMSIFSAFEPILNVLTSAIQGITSVFTGFMGVLDDLGPFGTVIKWAIGALVLFGTSFGASVMTFVSKGLGGFKDLFTGKGSMISKALGGGGGESVAQGASPAKSGGILGKVKGIFSKVSPIDTSQTGGGAGVGDLATSAESTGKTGSKIDMGGVMKFAAAMALIGVAVAAFGVGMNQMGGIGMLEILGKGAISIGLLALAVWGISKMSSGIDLSGIIKFSLAMGLIGLAMIPFAFAATMMTNIDWLSVLAGVGVMALVMVGLALLGTVAITVGWLILAGAGLLAAAGLSLMVAAEGLLMTADAFNALSAINWEGFAGMGMALLAVVPGMLGFSFAAMLFANPMALLGIMMMSWALSGLVSVMVPLADSLTLGADSLDRFADGLTKLSAAADALSLEKLEKLKELSDSMANAGSGGAAMAAMASMANSSGGAGGDGEVRKIEVNVKMNGRDMQNFIVKDTALLK